MGQVLDYSTLKLYVCFAEIIMKCFDNSPNSIKFDVSVTFYIYIHISMWKRPLCVYTDTIYRGSASALVKYFTWLQLTLYDDYLPFWLVRFNTFYANFATFLLLNSMRI